MCGIGAIAGIFGKNGKEWVAFKFFAPGCYEKWRFFAKFGQMGRLEFDNCKIFEMKFNVFLPAVDFIV